MESVGCFGQNKNKKRQSLNNLNLEVINGVRFSRYLYAGVGLGATANFSDEAILFPVFIDLKG
ncbi:MAG: hypothetical protein SOW71_07690, partial [Eubacteriales bacterium]|nr:hypothetical protein [Eubacteriales bacterium]